MGCHLVAVVILHVHKYEIKVTRKFKSGGLNERHVLYNFCNSQREFITFLIISYFPLMRSAYCKIRCKSSYLACDTCEYTIPFQCPLLEILKRREIR